MFSRIATVRLVDAYAHRYGACGHACTRHKYVHVDLLGRISSIADITNQRRFMRGMRALVCRALARQPLCSCVSIFLRLLRRDCCVSLEFVPLITETRVILRPIDMTRAFDIRDEPEHHIMMMS